MNAKTSEKINKLEQRLANFEKKSALEKGIQTAQSLLKLDENNFNARKFLGLMYVTAQRYSQALPHMEAVCQIKKTDAELLMYLGLAQLGYGSKQEAIKTFKRASLFSPKDTKILTNMALAYRENSEYEQAIKILERVIKVAPNSPAAYLNIALCQLALGKASLALEVLETLLQKHQNYVAAWNAKGMVMEHLFREDDAEACYRKAIELDALNDDAYSNLGALLLKKEHTDSAIKVFKKAVSINPENVNSKINLISAYKTAEDKKAAYKLTESALRMHPKNPYFWGEKIKYEIEKNKDMQAAIKVCEQALEKLEPNADIWHIYADLLNRELELDLALDAIRKARKLNSSKGAYEQTEINIQGEIKILSCLGVINKPIWRGEDLTDKRLLIFNQQGIGDEILFAALYNQLLNAFPRLKITLVASRKLQALFKSSFPQIEVIDSTLSSGVSLTLSSSGFSAFGTEKHDQLQKTDFIVGASNISDLLDKYKKSTLQPYLKAETNEVAYWAQYLLENSKEDRLKIGICWRSKNLKSYRTSSYARVEDLAPLFELHKAGIITLVNLQYDDVSEELDYIRENFGIEILNPENLNQMDELDKVAALITNLDLILTSYTSVHRITAALGIPVWSFYRQKSLGIQKEALVVKESKMANNIDWILNKDLPWEAFFDKAANIIKEKDKCTSDSLLNLGELNTYVQ